MKNKGFCSAVLIIVLIFSLTGCSLETERDLVRVPENTYQETGRAMSYVQRGDVAIGIEEELQLKNYKETKYGFVATRMDASLDEDLEFDQLYVNVGDTVKKGELLLKLRSEHLDNDIEKYTEQKEKAQIRLNHLRNRSAIDENEDNSYEINNCLDEIQVAEGYLQELETSAKAESLNRNQSGQNEAGYRGRYCRDILTDEVLSQISDYAEAHGNNVTISIRNYETGRVTDEDLARILYCLAYAETGRTSDGERELSLTGTDRELIIRMSADRLGIPRSRIIAMQSVIRKYKGKLSFTRSEEREEAYVILPV